MVKKLKHQAEDNKHFYASSVYTWKVDTDLDALLKYMKAEGAPFQVILVPLPVKAHYEIEYYMPQVKGCVSLGLWSNK